MRNRGSHAYLLTQGGIFISLSMVLMLLLRIFPTADLFFNFLLSLGICIAIIQLGKVKALLIYGAIAAFSFLILIPPYNLAFILIGGIYPFVKYTAEHESSGRRFGRTACLLVKLSLAVAFAAIYAILLMRLFLPVDFAPEWTSLPWFKLWILPLVAVFMLLYDFMLSSGIDFYFRYIKPWIQKRSNRRNRFGK